MRIAFLSEGTTELGISPGALEERPRPQSFALKVLVERILDTAGRIDACQLPARAAGCGPILKKGYARLREAARLGGKGAVMLVDADGHGPERLKILRQHRERVWSKKDRLFIPVAVGVAIEKFEAWLLADEAALCVTLGLPRSPGSAESPEGLKGRRGGPDDPKARLKAWFEQDGLGPRTYQEQVVAVVEAMDLDTVSRVCPRGFGPFREDVVRQLGESVGRR